MGSPYYMSPEQMTSAKSVDHRTDIWALGIILHELLTGKVPYQGETIPEICVQVLQNPPPRLTELRPGAPRDLEAIIDKALAKNRDERYATIADFAADISAYASVTAVHSVERISKVLGVVASARPSIQLDEGFSTRQLGTDKTTWGQKGLGQTAERIAGNKTQESEGLSNSTLGGAAHEQPDYKPPTSSGKVPLVIGALALVAGAALVFMLSSGEGEASEQDPVVATEVVTAVEHDQKKTEPEESEKQADEATKDALAKDEPSKDEPSKDEPSKDEPSKDEPSKDVSPAPLTPTHKPAPRPTQKPSTSPSPRPAPSPQPSPGNSSLYLDRK
jgi:serine/threonine protein kinase